MPLKYFICPDGQQYDKDLCILGVCRMHNRCATLPYLKQVGEVRVWNGLPSTTQLLNGPREEYLRIKKDYAVHPYKKAFAALGTGVHSSLDTDDDWSFSEERLKDSIASGQFDRLEKQEDGSWWLIELKTYGSYKVNKALGLVAKKIPAFYPNGDPVLYVKSGSWGKAGTQKNETIFVAEGEPDMDDLKLQLNRNRMLVESNLQIKVAKLKCFIIVRDGNTITARDRGITEECYYIDVPFIDDVEVNKYFSDKSSRLKHAVECDELPDYCSAKECWDDMKCKFYCDVKEFCGKVI
jgi:hypothetical protein